MGIELGLQDENTVNTAFGPLVALSAHYQKNKTLEPLNQVQMRMKSVDHTPMMKLSQTWLSILMGCEYVSEINTRQKPDTIMAQAWDQERFADQSTIARTLDRLTQMNIDQLRAAVHTIWSRTSQTLSHDWRGYLWLDFDLSGLPCGPQAEASRKGYFSGKKTSQVVN